MQAVLAGRGSSRWHSACCLTSAVAASFAGSHAGFASGGFVRSSCRHFALLATAADERCADAAVAPLAGPPLFGLVYFGPCFDDP